VRLALESIRRQTFTDFEVVVVDNHTGAPCRAAFDEFADDRFHYVRPAHPLPMYENWELGARHTTGQYVTFLIDKTVLRVDALQVLHDTAQAFSADLVSWRADAYQAFDQTSGIGPGVCYPWPQQARAPYVFDARREIARRFAVDVRRGAEGEHYFLGKICFGAFRRDLLDRMARTAGRLFFPLAPDYTSMLSALALAEIPVDAGRSCLVQNITELSNGWNVAHKSERARMFLEESDATGAVFNQLPIAGLYASVHNVVCRDYLHMQRLLGGHFPHIHLNMANVITRAAEDLQDVVFVDRQSRTEQHSLLQEQVDRCSGLDQSNLKRSLRRYKWIARRQRARMVVRRAVLRLPMAESALPLIHRAMNRLRSKQRSSVPPIPFNSVLAAAAAPVDTVRR
jgi:hypothetical protein